MRVPHLGDRKQRRQTAGGAPIVWVRRGTPAICLFSKESKKMKYFVTTAIAVIGLGAIAPATAQDAPSTKGPPVTMGDEGKLPATGTMTNKVPEMGSTSGATGAGTGTSGSASPK